MDVRNREKWHAQVVSVMSRLSITAKALSKSAMQKHWENAGLYRQILLAVF